jgi:hypothetical protein
LAVGIYAGCSCFLPEVIKFECSTLNGMNNVLPARARNFARLLQLARTFCRGEKGADLSISLKLPRALPV